MSGLRLANKSRTKRPGRKAGSSAGRGGSPRRGGRANARRRRPLLALRLPTIEWRPRKLAVLALAVVLVAGMSLVVLSASRWGRGSERFVLSSFDVRGNRVLTEDEVLALSGAELGSNLLEIRISDLEERMEASPRVDRAQALRVLPDRVVVTLDEKRPAALVAAGGGVLEVTDDGTVLAPVEQTGAVDLPVITGAVGDVQVGVDEVPGELAQALHVLRLSRDVSEGLWREISEVRIAPGSGLVIYTVADGAEIRVGSGALEVRDLTRLWNVLQDVRDRGRSVESIDMRFRDQIVVRLA